jgi:AraC family transcriptional regulator of arabinose operon
VNNRENPHRILRPRGTDVWILEFTISGQGLLHAGDKVSPLTAGQVTLIAPGVSQDYGMDSSVGTWDHQWVCFIPRRAWLDWLTWPALHPGILTVTIPPADHARMQALLAEVITYLHGPLKRREEFAMNALEAALLWCDTANPHSLQARVDPRVQRVVEVICTRYAEPLTLTELAEIAGISPWRLIHLCTAQIGQPPLRFLLTHRLSRAADLLLMTGKSITAIAADTGFANPCYFSRLFHRHYGASPRDYRQRT